jgi:hypothetical protein
MLDTWEESNAKSKSTSFRLATSQSPDCSTRVEPIWACSDSLKASGSDSFWEIQRSAAAFEVLKCSQRNDPFGLLSSHAVAASASIGRPAVSGANR